MRSSCSTPFAGKAAAPSSAALQRARCCCCRLKVGEAGDVGAGWSGREWGEVQRSYCSTQAALRVAAARGCLVVAAQSRAAQPGAHHLHVTLPATPAGTLVEASVAPVRLTLLNIPAPVPPLLCRPARGGGPRLLLHLLSHPPHRHPQQGAAPRAAAAGGHARGGRGTPGGPWPCRRRAGASVGCFGAVAPGS